MENLHHLNLAYNLIRKLDPPMIFHDLLLLQLNLANNMLRKIKPRNDLHNNPIVKLEKITIFIIEIWLRN